MTRALIVALVCLSAGPALAHPHVFIDTRIEVILNDRNEATALRISWTYDDLYSLYIVGDMGLDPDWDGKLTAEEEAQLTGFDMEWIEGFDGDTYPLMDGKALALTGPRDWTAAYAGGKITSTHMRDFVTPVPVGADPLVVQVYDPGYYTAYTVLTGPDLSGPDLTGPDLTGPMLTGGHGCTARVFQPDLDAADAALQAALKEYTPDIDLEAEFPAIGASYAEEVRVTCAAP